MLYTREPPKVEARAKNEGYNRVEIAIPRNVATKLLELALKKLWFLEENEADSECV